MARGGPGRHCEQVAMARVLVACEYSGVVRDAFAAHGHQAVSCDVLPSERPGPHIIADVLDVLDYGWDLMVAHPPCQYLATSGVRWLHEDPDRLPKTSAGARFFNAMLEAPIPLIAVENPVQHGYAKKMIRGRPAQAIQPWMFGEDTSKKTLLWLKGLPPLRPTKVLVRRRYANQTPSGQNKLGPGDPRRALERARTPDGVAEAMASQWGSLLTNTLTQSPVAQVGC